jgi:hypothetical protein
MDSALRLVLTLGPGLKAARHGDLVVLDWTARRIADHVRYEHRVYEESHKGMAGASWHGSHLLVATEAELLEYTCNPFRLVGAHSFPFLNDVHHVAASNGHIWVCNTGLDTLEELDDHWRPLRTHDLVVPFGRRPRFVLDLLRADARKSWNRLNGRAQSYGHLRHRATFPNLVKLIQPTRYRLSGRDLRTWDFRPHVLHPNHLLPRGDDMWVTLLHTGEIVSLATGAVIAGDLGHPHDGIVVGDSLFVTDCGSNRLIVIQGLSHHRRERREVRVTKTLEEGFLRGVAVARGTVFVGLTARRGSRDAYRTARVCALDAGSLHVLDTWEAPTEYGMSLFSILPVPHGRTEKPLHAGPP